MPEVAGGIVAGVGAEMRLLRHSLLLRGYTVMELVLVTAIILLVAGLLMPVLRRAADRSKEAACISNLRAFHTAIMMYRTAYDGDGVYGSVYEMGLPPTLKELYPEFLASRATYRCSLGTNPHRGYAAVYTKLYPQRPDEDMNYPKWVGYSQEYKEDSILMMDWHHDPNGWNSSPYMSHRAIGMFLGGHVKTRTQFGDPTLRLWWNQ